MFHSKLAKFQEHVLDIILSTEGLEHLCILAINTVKFFHQPSLLWALTFTTKLNFHNKFPVPAGMLPHDNWCSCRMSSIPFLVSTAASIIYVCCLLCSLPLWHTLEFMQSQKKESNRLKSGDKTCHAAIRYFFVSISLDNKFKHSMTSLPKCGSTPSYCNHIHPTVSRDKSSKKSSS